MRLLPLTVFLLITSMQAQFFNTESEINPWVFNKLGSASVENGEINIVFTVYECWSSVKFNLTIINLKDECILRERNWGYFNAEIYTKDGVYLGKVRSEDDDKTLFFLAKKGTHVRHWLWDYTVINDEGSKRLEAGSYKIRGVFVGLDYTIKTDAFEVYFEYRSQLPPAKMYVNKYGGALMYASLGVLVSGFIQQIYISLFYGESENLPSKRRMITILWMLVIMFSTLLLALSSEFGYEVIRIFIDVVRALEVY